MVSQDQTTLRGDHIRAQQICFVESKLGVFHMSCFV